VSEPNGLLRFARLLPTIALLTAVLPAAQGDELLRDPTRPPQVREKAKQRAAPFAVSAIFVAGERRVAVVNGQIAGVGDEVAGASVTNITPNAVTLRYRGKPLRVRLPGAKVRVYEEAEQ